MDIIIGALTLPRSPPIPDLVYPSPGSMCLVSTQIAYPVLNHFPCKCREQEVPGKSPAGPLGNDRLVIWKPRSFACSENKFRDRIYIPEIPMRSGMTGALSEIEPFLGFVPFPVLILSLHPHFSGSTSSINYLYMKPYFEIYFWRCQLANLLFIRLVYYYFLFNVCFCLSRVFLAVWLSLVAVSGDSRLVAVLGFLAEVASHCGERAVGYTGFSSCSSGLSRHLL